MKEWLFRVVSFIPENKDPLTIKVQGIRHLKIQNQGLLLCYYHDDVYPAGNEQMGPATSLDGRNIGQDFSRKDGWSMYHGETVPGFPRHPHRGFETVTLNRKGYSDFTTSMGSSGRVGPGDVEWITAGKGMSHSGMIPLLDNKNPNPMESFQLWLNLPKANKFVDPLVTILWAESIPILKVT